MFLQKRMFLNDFNNMISEIIRKVKRVHFPTNEKTWNSAKDKDLPAKTNKNKAYLVSATKRSGHHAVIYWLLGHDENIVFLNHIREINRRKYIRKLKQNSEHNYLVNFENDVMKFNLDEQIETKYEIKRIGVVRSFRNWLASLMKIKSTKTFRKQLAIFLKIRSKRAGNNIERLRELCEIWVKMADTFSNDEKYCLIYFDEWFVNKNYRKKYPMNWDWSLQIKIQTLCPRMGVGLLLTGERMMEKVKK